MIWRLLLATPSPAQAWLAFGFGAYGLARLFSDLLSTNEMTRAEVDQLIFKVINKVLDETDTSSSEVVLDFDKMAEQWETYGERGVYAYLIENGIAKDKYHGEYIIKDLFLPYYTKMQAAKKAEAAKNTSTLPDEEDNTADIVDSIPGLS